MRDDDNEATALFKAPAEPDKADPTKSEPPPEIEFQDLDDADLLIGTIALEDGERSTS